MSRCLLHINHLLEFKDWLGRNGISWRAGLGDYQVIQVAMQDGTWQVVYKRDHMPEHYTCPHPMERMVKAFIRERKTAQREKERT